MSVEVDVLLELGVVVLELGVVLLATEPLVVSVLPVVELGLVEPVAAMEPLVVELPVAPVVLLSVLEVEALLGEEAVVDDDELGVLLASVLSDELLFVASVLLLLALFEVSDEATLLEPVVSVDGVLLAVDELGEEAVDEVVLELGGVEERSA